MYACSLTFFFFAIIVFRVNRGRLFAWLHQSSSRMGFSPPLLRCAVVLLKSELVSLETPFGEKILLKDNDSNNNNKHC
jgi:hypothetical protein